MSTAVHSWTCPGCGRRVPLRAAVCHCGTPRDPARPAAGRTGRPAGNRPPSRAPLDAHPRTALALWRTLPLDVQALLLGGLLSFAAGLGWLAYAPARPERLPPLLGYVDASPTAVPVAVRRPPFKLPWWK